MYVCMQINVGLVVVLLQLIHEILQKKKRIYASYIEILIWWLRSTKDIYRYGLYRKRARLQDYDISGLEERLSYMHSSESLKRESAIIHTMCVLTQA